MSVRIGEVNPRGVGAVDVHVQVSRGGVELHSEKTLSLDPTQARNYAALLVRAADEVERMRGAAQSERSDVLVPAAPWQAENGERWVLSFDYYTLVVFKNGDIYVWERWYATGAGSHVTATGQERTLPEAQHAALASLEWKKTK